MKILFLSSEVVPFAKTGGLADVAGALPKELKSLGHDVRIVMPRYQMIDVEKFFLKPLKLSFDIDISGQVHKTGVFEANIPGTDVITYFIDNEEYFGSRKELYMVAGKDYPDNLERFTLYSKATLQLLKGISFKPDVIHCNDWQTALVAAYLKTLYADDPFFKNTAIVYSVHNMGYLGLFPKESLPITGLSWSEYGSEKMEFWGNISISKAGFVYSDIISTVSETYAKEIQTEEYGCGLDGLLRYRSQDVIGILNGIDLELWDPSHDPHIAKKYNSENLYGKLECKLMLQKNSGLPAREDVPVMGMITRLVDQKGLDIFSEVLDAIMGLKFQLVILGTGDTKYHELLSKAKQKYPNQISLNLTFDATVAQTIYAGSDVFIMPSRYEPCGLGQLISFRYGTVPIVRSTGGLADTVHDFSLRDASGDGFVFTEYSGRALFESVRHAAEVYRNRTVWSMIVRRIMKYDYSWKVSAKKYVDLYEGAMQKKMVPVR
ncbi:MAG: glycogen synthase GlgA [bacterium]